MENFDELFKKWRKNFNNIALLVASTTLLLELVVSYLLITYYPQTIKLSIETYILLYIVLPSCINFSLVLLGRCTLNKDTLSEQMKNYSSVLILSGQFLVISCVHNVFTLTTTLLCFPIFLTLMYGDKKMTTLITALTICFVSISFVFALFDGHTNDAFFPIQMFVGYILLLG